jgi:hypothetical protein
MLGLREMTWRHIALFMLAVVWLILAHPDQNPWPDLVAGGALIIVGEALRIWATGHLRKNKVLTIGGPYRFVRDPMYVGSLLIVTGFMLAGDQHALIVIFWLIYFAYYIPRKRRIECSRLLRKFGADYAHYMAEVGSIIPRLKPYQGAGQSRFAWRQCFVNDEHGIIVLLLGVAMILCVKYTLFHNHGLPMPTWLSFLF